MVTRLTDQDRADLRGLGQGQVPAAVEKILARHARTYTCEGECFDAAGLMDVARHSTLMNATTDVFVAAINDMHDDQHGGARATCRDPLCMLAQRHQAVP